MSRRGGWLFLVGLVLLSLNLRPAAVSVGPVLAAILMVAGSESSITYGMGLLAVYSAGLGIPFILAAAAMKPFMTFMTRFRKHLQTVERVIGALLVLTGILFLTGSMAEMAYWLLETFPSLGTSG